MNELKAFDEDAADPERAKAARTSTWVSVLVNLVLTALQVGVGVFAGSQALVADGVHSLSDLASDFVVLLALKHSQKGPDEDHPYGHQRYENAASLILGGLLLVVALGMVVAAVGKLGDPASISPVSAVALWVAIGTLLAKEVLFRYTLSVAQRVHSSLLAANAWHARSDAASSLVVAVGIGGNLMGWGLLDPLAASMVGFMVGRMGWRFFWDALHDLTDRAASEEETRAIRSDLLEVPGVRGVHDLRTRKTGDVILVDVHIEVDGQLTVAQGHSIADEARRRILQRHRVLDVMTHVDPV